MIAQRRPRRARRPRAGQRGFTLIELMVALVVSSLLVGMILAIFVRISIAYRGQQQVAEVQSKLAAARAKIELDAKHAGLAIPDGFYMKGGGPRRAPLRVVNNSNAPDEIAFAFADLSVQAALRSAGTCDNTQCAGLDDTTGFAQGDVIVRSTPRPYVENRYYPAAAPIAEFHACVFQVQSVGPTQLVFEQTGPWGESGNGFCTAVTPYPNPTIGKTMFYKLAVRHWRIDPARPADGVLQLSQGGSLIGVNDWQDMGYGFTDIQVATRFYEPQVSAVDTPDPDLDPKRNWYSSEYQELLTNPPTEPKEVPIQISISIVARTERDVEGIASGSTPNLTVSTNVDNNTIGDRAPISLPSSAPALSGNRIVRYTTFQVDLRNLGVGL